MTKIKFIDDWINRIQEWNERQYEKTTPNVVRTSLARSNHVKNKPIPPLFDFTYRFSKKDIPLKEVWDFLNKKSLFVLSWGLRGKSASKLQDEFNNLLEEWKRKGNQRGFV